MNQEMNEKKADVRLSALEIRVTAVEALVNNLTIGAPGVKVGAKKKSDAEKEKMKADLLKGVPYDQKKLSDLTGGQLKMLASALKVKSFGMKREDIVKAVLGVQKKK
jgi:hypothetical protein